MPYNKDARIQKIKELYNDKEARIGRKEIYWEGKLTPMDVFKIPIEYLVYNKYNGRILSRTKSQEVQKKKIDIETEEGHNLIEIFLYASNTRRNLKTESNIKAYGQREVGIITKDGIVIDGNRRLMFLNRLSKENPNKTDQDPDRFKNFKAVILPITLADDPDEIRKLETSYQMGEDEKLGYNPIEKYLKVQELEKNKISVSKISNWMNEKEKKVKEYLAAMKTMDDYLEHLGYEGIYTQLDGREDWFLSLTKWENNFRLNDGGNAEGASGKAFDGYKNSDVDDLVLICYDYIRAKNVVDGKQFRWIAEGTKDNHIFGNKELWDKFKEKHFHNT